MKLPLLPNIHHIANSFMAASLAPMLLVTGVGIAGALDEATSGAPLAWPSARGRPPCSVRPSSPAVHFRCPRSSAWAR